MRVSVILAVSAALSSVALAARGSDATNVKSTAAGVWSLSLPAKPAGAPVVLILPGLGGNPWTVNDSGSRFAPLLSALTGAGYAVVSVQASGTTHWGRAEAGPAAVAQLAAATEAHPELGRDVALIGESMGNLLARQMLDGGALGKAGWNVTRYIAIDPVMSLYAAYRTPALTQAVRVAYPDLPEKPTLEGWRDSSARKREPGTPTWLSKVPTTVVASRTDSVVPFPAQAGQFIGAARKLGLPVKLIETKGPHVDASHFKPELILPLLR